MAQRGLINPISVVKSGELDYTIIAGERRLGSVVQPEGLGYQGSS
jgi:ParB-like nuclease family protein